MRNRDDHIWREGVQKDRPNLGRVKPVRRFGFRWPNLSIYGWISVIHDVVVSVLLFAATVFMAAVLVIVVIKLWTALT